MNKTKKALFLLVIAIAGFFTSCKEYYDDLQGIGQRVVKLEADSLQFTHQYENLLSVIGVLKGHLNIDSLYQDANGDWVLLVDTAEHHEPIILSNGSNGADGEPFDYNTLSVRDSTDGKTYWVYKGKWMTDEDGKAIEVPIVNGNDAEQGDPREVDGVPVIVVDPVTGHFMITYDTVYSAEKGIWVPTSNANWVDTGIVYKGETGGKGDKGETGDDGIITINKGKDVAPYTSTYVYLDDTGKYLVIVTPYGSYAIKIESSI